MNTADKTIFANELKLLFFMLLISVIILFFGYLITEMFGLGMDGIIITGIIAAIINFVSYFFSKSIVLKSQHAIPMSKKDFPQYYDMVQDMCERNGIIMPELYYINSSALNAFATGRSQKDAAVVVTSGLLKKVPLDEISGVIGHELSHIVHKDILITGFIGTMVGFITIMASFMRNASIRNSSRKNSNNSNSSVLLIIGLATSILAPFIGLLIRMAVSRSREYMADATGGQICGNPQLLAKALYRISRDGSEMPMANEAVAPLYISNPLKKDIWGDLFSTHPDINDRIKRLQEMSNF